MSAMTNKRSQPGDYPGLWTNMDQSKFRLSEGAGGSHEGGTHNLF